MSKLLLLILWGVCLVTYANSQPLSGSNDATRNMELAVAASKSARVDSVTFYWQKARENYLQNQNWEQYVTDFTNFAKTLYTNNQAAKGIQALKQIRKDVQLHFGKAAPQEIEICFQIARGYYFQEEYDSCVTYVKQNLMQLERMPPGNLLLERANHYNLLGAVYNQSGQAAQALEEYEKVLLIRIAKLGAEDNQVASIFFNMGNAYSNLKLYNKAIDAYNNGMKIREKALGNKHPSLASIYLNVGIMYDDKGEYDHAIQYFDRALAIFRKNPKGFEDRIADLFNNLAISYKNKGAYQESSSFHEQSIQTYEQLAGDNSEKLADVYSNLAILTGLKGDTKQSVTLHEKALHLYEKSLNAVHPLIITARNNLGIAYADNGEYERALKYLQETMPFIENNAAQQAQYANLNNDVADIYFKFGNVEASKTYNLKALAIQQSLFKDKNYKLAITYNSLAKIAAAEKDNKLANNYLQKALAANHHYFETTSTTAAPSANGYIRYEYFVESLLLKAKLVSADARLSQASLLQARLLYQIADSVLIQIQNELISSEDKIQLSEKIYQLSQRAIENCIQLAEVTGNQSFWEEAFAYAEKSKNTVLTQSIAANHAKRFAGIPDSLILLEDELQSDLRYYTLQLTEQPDSAARILYQSELFTAQQAYRTLVRQLETEYSLYYKLKYDRTTPSVSAIQATLPANTALVSYFTSDSLLYSFVITKNKFEVYRAAIAKDFYEQQVGLRKTIIWQLNEDYVKLASNLYQELFPFTLDSNVESLIIIPDGNLSKLPFEALLTQKVNPRGNINFSTLPYLLQKYQISYALSSTLYYQKQFESTDLNAASEGLLAYAPVFSEPQNINSYTNGTRNPFSNFNGGVGRTLTMDGNYVSELPATADEVQEIAAVFQQKGKKASTFLFRNANENQLKRGDMNRSKYIHIATHGFINEAQPDLSGLLLFPDSTEQEDHILYSGEVYGLNLRADLVVLSACETGLGKVANGEGLLGLSRAFFYAGAKNLVVSLWKVQDQATADLMVDFYQQHLNSANQQFAMPLRQAKLDMMRSADFSHPYYWSAFVLIGR